MAFNKELFIDDIKFILVLFLVLLVFLVVISPILIISIFFLEYGWIAGVYMLFLVCSSIIYLRYFH
jgi:hypothetical protein